MRLARVFHSWDAMPWGGATTTSEPVRVTVELTEDELVTLLAWVAPESALLDRLNGAFRIRHSHESDDRDYFWFTGTVVQAIALLELAIARAPAAVPRIRDAIRLATAKGTE